MATFRETVTQHGIPASTLTDNGMVFTTRLAGGRGGRNGFEHELRRLHVVQKNSRPNHPTTCGKVERFQQTTEELATRPTRSSLHDRPSCRPCSTCLSTSTTIGARTGHCRTEPPRHLYTTLPKALPGRSRDTDTHDRVRHDRVDDSGVVTLRVGGRLHHIGIGRTHARTHVLLLVHDLDVRVVNAVTGELLRELILDPNRDYQPTGAPKGPTKTTTAEPN